MRTRGWLINPYALKAPDEPPGPTAKWWQIRADASTAEILLYGEIGWDVTAGQFVDELNSITAPNITLRINSVGGNAYDGVSIYNRLINHHARITAVVDGFAASAATIVMMSGDEIIAEPGTSMVVHNASGLVAGDYRDMRGMMEWLNDLCEQMAGIYAARAGGTVSDWRAIMDAETRYTPEKAQAAGLVDRVNQPKSRPEPPTEDTMDDEQLVAMSDRDAVRHLYAGRVAAPPPPGPGPAVSPPLAGPQPTPAAAEIRPGWADLDITKLAAAFAAANTQPIEEAAR